MFRNKKAEAIKKKPEKAKKTSKADSKTPKADSKTPKADSKTPKADSKKSAKDWTEEETTMLIEILESKPCLWDVHHAEYSKRDIKEIAYSEMASNFDTDIASIKQKLNNLRTRFGKELSKERNTKSGQATEELYNSNWPFFDQLAFLTPVIGASKSRDTLKRMSVYNVMMIMKMWLSHPKRGSPPSLKKNLIFSKNAQMLSLPTKQLVPIV